MQLARGPAGWLSSSGAERGTELPASHRTPASPETFAQGMNPLIPLDGAGAAKVRLNSWTAQGVRSLPAEPEVGNLIPPMSLLERGWTG